MTRYYRVAEFAGLAGVTVRTLQYYDREGLLKPAENTESGYRLYRLDDLVRLQQILTLKWMGFSLREIRAILTDPGYELRASLMRQRHAVDAQIVRLQEASRALEAMIDQTGRADSVEMDTEMDAEMNSEMLNIVIRAVTGGSKETWPGRYYSDAAWAGIQARRLAYTPVDLEQVQAQWQALFAEFERQRGEPPASRAVQELAAQMHSLLEGFTGGNPEIEAGLAQMAEDAGTGALSPEHRAYTPYGNVDADLREFIQEAFRIFLENSQKKRLRKGTD